MKSLFVFPFWWLTANSNICFKNSSESRSLSGVEQRGNYDIQIKGCKINLEGYCMESTTDSVQKKLYPKRNFMLVSLTLCFWTFKHFVQRFITQSFPVLFVAVNDL